MIRIIENNANSKNTTNYYGHEMTQIFSVSSQILRQLSENATTETVETFTDRIVGVFGNVLGNKDTWDELNSVRFACITF